ncbi:GNAT family N-acetyltransferase [Streptomyces sp. I05A-00742]|uniref:GNAT family N-acetyltransferase n=1 Tax=Streptomyces sp. I05A-00742 TaxID=2732853 RepID=UPI0014891FCA|nr:GNAT family N-acetyltransferase [Streptomyces sp. I05A-00742]
MPEEEIITRPLDPDEWRLYRSVRLTALADTPEAFGSTWDRENAFPEELWRERLSRRNTFLAERRGEACGLVGVVPTGPRTAELVSLWVAAGARGTGAGGLLVDAAVGWAADRGLAEIRLWVTDGNDRAERLYRRKGFARTGESQPLRADDDLTESAMARPVRRGLNPRATH